MHSMRVLIFGSLAEFFYSLKRRQNDIENLMLFNEIRHLLSNVRFLTLFQHLSNY